MQVARRSLYSQISYNKSTKLCWDDCDSTLIGLFFSNPNCDIHLIEDNVERMMEFDWVALCNNTNPNVIQLLSKHVHRFINDKNAWEALSSNPSAMPLLIAHPDKIDWFSLCSNPSGVSLVEEVLRRGNAAEIEEKVNWFGLSFNPNAMDLIEANLDKVFYPTLCANTNPRAIPLILANMDKVNWAALSANPSAVSILAANLDKVHWPSLCTNPSPDAVLLVQANLDKAEWVQVCKNPSAMQLIEDYPDRMTPDAWMTLCTNPSAVEYISEKRKNGVKIADYVPSLQLSLNSNWTGVIQLMIEWGMLSLNYPKLKANKYNQDFCQELVAYVLNPARLLRMATQYGNGEMDMSDYMDCM